ncbi:MAG: hypothetical protein K6E81_10155 [Lachnospiraceae bacterium]|nr:hypothetical protein [Lachnospiraceae bacterium]
MSAHLKFFPQFYISEDLKGKNPADLRAKLEAAKGGLYLITPAACEQDQLDLIPSGNLLSKAYEGRELAVCGIASGAETAAQLVATMTEDCFAVRGDYNLREFCLCGQWF